MLLLLVLTRGRRVERAALVGSNGVGGGVGHIRRVELRQTASNSSWEWTWRRASGVLQLWQSVSVDIESTVPYSIAVSVEEQDSSQPAQQFVSARPAAGCAPRILPQSTYLFARRK